MLSGYPDQAAWLRRVAGSLLITHSCTKSSRTLVYVYRVVDVDMDVVVVLRLIT